MGEELKRRAKSQLMEAEIHLMSVIKELEGVDPTTLMLSDETLRADLIDMLTVMAASKSANVCSY